MNFKPLFESTDLHLTAIDQEKDAELESKWTLDPTYLRMFGPDIAHPLSVYEIKQHYEKLEKEIKEERNKFYFAVRLKGDERLIGMAFIDWVEWSNGNCSLKLGIGNPQDRGKGWGCQVLEMMLRFAFAELNMHRISATIPEYNHVARHLADRFGFIEEGVVRKAFNRQGCRWDDIYYGLLKKEWEKTVSQFEEKEK